VNHEDELQEFIGPPIISREIEHRDRKRTFYFRELGTNESEAFLETILPKREKNGKAIPGALPPKHANARIIAKIVCKENGDPLFTEEEAGKVPTKLAIALRDASLHINGLTEEAKEEAKNE